MWWIFPCIWNQNIIFNLAREILIKYIETIVLQKCNDLKIINIIKSIDIDDILFNVIIPKSGKGIISYAKIPGFSEAFKKKFKIL